MSFPFLSFLVIVPFASSDLVSSNTKPETFLSAPFKSILVIILNVLSSYFALSVTFTALSLILPALESLSTIAQNSPFSPYAPYAPI